MIHRYRTSPMRAYLGLAIGIASLAFSAIFVRWADAPGVITAFYRMAIAAVLLALPFARRVQSRGALSRRGVGFAVLGGVLFAADLGLWTEGVRLAGATNPTLLSNTAPLWVGLGAFVFFKERLNKVFWAGLFLAGLGSAVILGLDNLQGLGWNVGSLLGLLSGVFYGGYYLAAQRGRETLDPLAYVWLAAAVSALVLFFTALLLRHPFTGYSAFTYLSFLMAGVITQVVGYLAINDALGRLPASIVSATMLGQPVATALLAYPILGERFSALQIAGGVAVLAGVFLVHRSRSKREHAGHPPK